MRAQGHGYLEGGIRLLVSLVLGLVFGLVLIGLVPQIGFAAEMEVIHSFQSDIVIHQDSTMQVTETIEVTSTGASIRHGIYREFPTRYRDSRGNNFSVGFDVTSVQRDGSNEPYRIESVTNGKRVTIGDKDVFIEAGRHTYKIVYNTYRQLGYFENNDELFWNVTGVGWMFPIQRASATITLPVQLTKSSTKAGGYTGPSGSTDKNLIYRIDPQGSVTFMTTKALNAYEGLSVYVTFPKGIVDQPSTLQYLQFWIKDNLFGVFLLLAALLSLGIYLYGWLKHGIDPRKGTIIPLYEPPHSLSPQDMRYIRRMGYDNKALTATILSMAVKGYLKIEEDATSKKTGYVITVTGDNSAQLSESERAVAASLPQVLELKQKYNPVMTTITRALTNSLQKQYSKVYFIWNAKFIGLAMLVTVAAGAFAIAFLKSSASVFAILPIVLLIVPHLFFWYLLKAPTKAGRALMDELEGFKRFLSVTEKDRLNLLNPPEQTPELFEKYLPYALALDVDQKWSEQFSTMFRRMADEGRTYSPGWYYGSAWNMHHMTGFSHSFDSSFSSSISAASTPPGSSSGAGGSSGGGGGGGGGGGW